MNKYSEELKKLFKLSEVEAIKLNHSYVGSEHFVLAILSNPSNMKKIFNKQSISYKKFKNTIINIIQKKKNINPSIYTSLFKKIIDNAIIYNTENGKSIINITDILISLIDENEGIAIEALKKLNCNMELLYRDILILNNNIAKSILREIGINLCEEVKKDQFTRTIGREKEIKRIVEILARKNKNNPILIGEAGVGKTAIVEEIAYLISKNKVPQFLKNKKIILLNISSVVSGTKYRGEFEEKLNKIIKEIEDDDELILFIDEIHTLVGAGGAEGAIDASNILKPALARNNIKCIGATTLNEYKKYIEKDKAFDRRFQKVLIKEPNAMETQYILKKIKKDYEKFHNVTISDELLNCIVDLSNKYIFDRKNPDKSIDILDEVCAKANVSSVFNKNNKVVTMDMLKSVLEEKSNSKILELEKYKVNINTLTNKVVGQEDVIKQINDILNTLKIKDSKKPLSLIFNGPSGVGKTFLVKELSKCLNMNLIKLDMGEYSSEISINRIIGSPQGYVGYDENNTTFESLKEYPYSIILLDEIDKAHYSVLDLFFNIFEEGKLKNSKNETINFNNCIFIMTTNKFYTNNIGFDGKIKQKINDDLFCKEFSNRIDYYIPFNQLERKHIKKIINNLCKNKNLTLSNEEINSIVLESNYKISGARKLEQFVSKLINSKILNH